MKENNVTKIATAPEDSDKNANVSPTPAPEMPEPPKDGGTLGEVKVRVENVNVADKKPAADLPGTGGDAAKHPYEAFREQNQMGGAAKTGEVLQPGEGMAANPLTEGKLPLMEGAVMPAIAFGCEVAASVSNYKGFVLSDKERADLWQVIDACQFSVDPRYQVVGSLAGIFVAKFLGCMVWKKQGMPPEMQYIQKPPAGAK